MKPIENVTYWKHKDIPGLELCHTISSSHQFPNHSHDNVFAIGLMENGECYVCGPGTNEVSMNSGEIAFINPCQIHSGVPYKDTKYTYRVLYFDIDFLTEIAADVFENDSFTPEFTRFVVKDRPLQLLLRLLSDLILRGNNLLEFESTVWEAIAGALAVYGSQKPNNRNGANERKAIQTAKDFLQDHLDAKLSLRDVAQAVGLSRYYFLRVFKQSAGLSPHAFRTQCRIEKAKILIKQGCNLSSIALDTGFTDQSHFNNKFRQFVGATPNQYRSILQA